MCNEYDIGQAIKIFSIAAGVIGLLFPQTGADIGMVPALHVFLVLYIGRQCSNEDYKVRAAFGLFTSIVGMQLFGAAGTAIVSLVGRFIPIAGNIAIAGVYFVATQSVGWMAFYYFKE